MDGRTKKHLITPKLLIKKYGSRCLKSSALRIPEGDKWLEYFVKKVKPDVILEIGTYRGITSAYLSQFCKKVITIDLKNGKLEETDDPILSRHELWADLGIKNIEFHAVKGNYEKKKIINHMHFDMVFIDGAHDKTIRGDYMMTRKCGNVLFHDYREIKDRPDKNQIFRFVNSLARRDIEVQNVFAFWKKREQKA